MANTISALHHITSAVIEDSPAKKLFSQFIPWILKIEKDNHTVFNITTPATKEVFDIIRRSCSVPYIIDKTLFYNNKYIDGLYPYIFKPKNDRKIINLNIVNWQKLDFITIKNETNNFNLFIN